MLDFARTLTLPSLGRYLGWRAGGRPGPVQLQARSGPRFELRPTRFGGRGNSDYGVAYEIFVHDFYRLPEGLDPAQVRLVADLGANVGFSVLHWLHRFPACRVIAFEPHPGHVEQARRNLALDGRAERVELHPWGPAPRCVGRCSPMSARAPPSSTAAARVSRSRSWTSFPSSRAGASTC
jgi:hypothetical protein